MVLTRLKELDERGLNGVYMDFRHFPPEGCYETAVEKRFLEKYNQFKSIGRKSEYYARNFARFRAKEMVRILAKWRNAFLDDPEFLFVNSVTSIPTLINPEMSLELLRVGTPKSEFSIATKRGINNWVDRLHPGIKPIKHETRMALGWNLMRELSKRPPHIWGSGFPNEEQLTAFVGSVLTHGAVANIDVIEDNILEAKNPEGGTPRQALKSI